MIVVFMGSFPDRIYRILRVVDIYNESYSDKLVFVSSYSFDYDKFVEKGQEIPPGNAQLNKITAIDLGVLEENILILKSNSKIN